ncbi:MAG: phosphate ABC transporter substrate-binding protein PstS [Bacteroidota bacterium]|nr:phosphate ABC transporter substrate-binding protein PstS [Bacteroidota bacterium]MDP4233112.1 phosphate ABC transporter substrate-binding protein PstS [Bacteroidota bacterium]MDP4241743.1 phosphate ABC transporter substrate-binding protein PstS [Bacteroidota bacterium]MDP4287401.1 phosphate ABC transporter substrate-binding protein PstS [Bacteroidota bacterium]
MISKILSRAALLAIGIIILSSQTVALRAQALNGAGSSFIYPAMTKWVDEYKKTTGTSVNYQSVGSGAGINNLIDGTIDFAGSDAPMNADEKGRAKGPVIHLPAVIGAVCVSYNVEGVQSGLALTGDDIADIFIGKIKYWDDPRLTKNNHGLRLPHEAIFAVHRSDGSGTNAIFTSYLSKVSPEWKSKIGEGKTVTWPEASLGGKGNAGVAAILKQHANSIGYVELAYAVENKIPYARIMGRNGQWIYPTVGTANQAAAASKIPEDLCTMITDASAGYPITGISWLIVYKTSHQPAELKKFLKWTLTKGQAYTNSLYYAAIPESMVKKEIKLIDSIQ